MKDLPENIPKVRKSEAGKEEQEEGKRKVTGEEEGSQ